MSIHIAKSIRHSWKTSFLTYLVSTILLTISSLAFAKDFAPIQWVDLIPKSDQEILLNPPQTFMGIADGSALDVIPEDPLANSVEQAIGASKKAPSAEEQAYFSALKSTNINANMANKNIRLAGFVVPVEYNDKQVVTEFFLVPYFGACIHMPPPPPNQIVYVKYPDGLTLEALYDPLWIEGTLLTELVENDLALAAYSLKADNVKPYDSYQ